MSRPTSARPCVEVLEAREVPTFGLDPTFGTGGIALDPLGGLHFQSAVATAPTAPGDKLVAAGNLVGPGADVAVVRLTPVGIPDPQFGGGDGVATFGFPYGHQVAATTILPDGKILVAGSATSADPIPGNDWFVFRLNADGLRDTTFGTNGEALIDFGSLDVLQRIEVQSNGKIVLAGFTATASPQNPSAYSQLAVARLTAAGAPDAAFGTGGKVTGSLEDGSWQSGGLAVQADGKVVVSGTVSPGYDVPVYDRTIELTVLRFAASGAPDAAFGTAGRAATNYGSLAFAYASDVVVLGDGRVVASGSSSGQGLLAWFSPTGATLSQEQFLGWEGGLSGIGDLVALPKGGVEAIGSTFGAAGGIAVEYHAAPGAAADRQVVNPGAGFVGAGVVAVGTGGKLVTAGVLTATGGFPFEIDAPFAAVRFADPGVTESPRTFVRWLSHYEIPDGGVSLLADVLPLIGAEALTEGTITFREGSTVLGTVDLTPTPSPFPWPSGPAGVSVFLPAGEHTVTAEYSGSARFAASSSAATFRVESQQVAVEAALAVSNANPAVGEGIFLTATLTALGGGTPPDAGLVTFYDGDRVLNNVQVVGGVAILATDSLTAGMHALRAVYTGAAGYAPAGSAPVTVTVKAIKVVTETTLTATAPAAVVGAPFTLTARVRGAGGGAVAGGTVTFTDGSTVLGTASVGPSGVATFTTALRVGARTLRAAYSGDAGASRSQSVAVTVAKAPTATSLAPSTPAPVPGQVIELIASVRVTAGSAFPVGAVEFRDGTRVLGTGYLDGRGQARHSYFVTAGTHALTAVYLGASTCDASTSAALVLTAGGRVTTTTALTVAVPAPVFGQPQTLTARVTGATAGRVDFFDGQVFIGSAAVSASGAASLTFASNLGAHRYRAVFAGTDLADTSASGWTSLTVAKALPSVALSGGTDGALRATVRAPYAGAPIGTVTFKANGVVLGTASVNGNGSATFNFVGRLAPGTYRITAAYGGSSCFLGNTSDPFDITIG